MGDERIGLALSGGGSRAMAFHLGCLRAMDKLGLLKDVEVLSTVSGGSVIGALYAANRDPFPVFEERVRAHLARGFVRPAIRKALTTTEGLRVLYCLLLLVPTNLFVSVVALAGGLLARILPESHRRHWRPEKLHPPFRRFASRTTILRRVFDEEVFNGLRLQDLPGDAPLLVVNAADLRTGSAFYFSQKSSGSWRLGELADKEVSLAQAVTASAAFPALLPALDEVLPFNKKDGTRREERVSLTDGGVYDNLGLAPLWPDRDPQISLNVTDVDTIICCRAGYGPRFDPPTQFLPARMKSVFYCVHERAQNAATKRLFDLLSGKKLKSVLMPYLGQNDSRLMFPTEDLISREETFNYPTNFSAMSEEWVERISRRGEQLTLALVKEHRSDLL
ncbi:patatin-like phospholipase family protein [Tritonibacter mobilis]|uniref:patatin-like phospholipase family protein n=1 Tax=Tritonibacter mobilis TaxID=379347 RepID=UPI000806CCEB|nr:patatin-like phospholipase family protein [Tritonibacter mobilis]